MPASSKNGKKTGEKLPLPKKTPKDKEEEEYEEEVEGSSEELEGDEGADQQLSSGSETSEAEEEECSTPSPALLMKKAAMKRKAMGLDVKKKATKKMKKPDDKEDDVDGEHFSEISAKDRSKKKKAAVDPSSQCVDLNLYAHAPQNVVAKRIQLASNIFMGCKMVEPDAKNQLQHEYPAIYFQRFTRSGKSTDVREWMTYIPLSQLPNVIAGLLYIKNENATFFPKNKE